MPEIEQENATVVPEESSDLSFFDGPTTVVRFPPFDPKGPPRFEYAEHRYLGDYISLQMDDGSKKLGSDVLFTLKNKSLLRYGEINAFAGDFYGSYYPISDGTNFEYQCTRFSNVFWYLNENESRTPGELPVLKDLMKEEVDLFNEAIRNHEDPSVAYSKLKDMTKKLINATIGRPLTQPGYLGLAAINWDHFGEHAHIVYTAGHTLALREASKPDGNLNVAYTINAFANHFLEDSFSAGHVRTPRKQLHGTFDKSADYCAKYMHDEESAIGLAVTNKRGDKWHMYGDKKLKDDVDDQNAKLCLEAVQTSADEVYAA
ncbi:hypothetical protein QM012_003991 [Aureobasidium pullulans]|uniref:Uncharacterized protein n=1 Tax=Aureobasidium pullulans TaxID=5580 RepID=A0ABR0T6E1_AURPU